MSDKFYTWVDTNRFLTFALGLCFLCLTFSFSLIHGVLGDALVLLSGVVAVALLTATGYLLTDAPVFYRGITQMWGSCHNGEMSWYTGRMMLRGAGAMLPISTPDEVIEDLYFLAALADTLEKLEVSELEEELS